MPGGKQSLKTKDENGYSDRRYTEIKQVQEEEDIEEGEKNL